MEDHRRGQVQVRLKRLPAASDLPLPAPATPDSAGSDLRAALEAPLTLAPGERLPIPTGIAIGLPSGFEGQVRPRSGLAARHGVTLVNAPGTIDADYRGEIRVILINLGSEPFTVEHGDRIAQLVVAPVVQPHFVEVDELDETERGAGGFGHTGR